MINRLTFEFRIWVHPADGDPPQIEVWVPGEESPDKGGTEWALNVLSDCDMHEMFGLNEDSYYQVVGRAQLRMSRSHDGEYDEDLDLLEKTVYPVDAKWFEKNESITYVTSGEVVTVDSEQAKRERSRLIAMAVENKELLQTESGDWVFWPSKDGYLTAHQLRWMAEELEFRNALRPSPGV